MKSNTVSLFLTILIFITWIDSSYQGPLLLKLFGCFKGQVDETPQPEIPARTREATLINLNRVLNKNPTHYNQEGHSIIAGVRSDRNYEDRRRSTGSSTDLAHRYLQSTRKKPDLVLGDNSSGPRKSKASQKKRVVRESPESSTSDQQVSMPRKSQSRKKVSFDVRADEQNSPRQQSRRSTGSQWK